MVTNPVIPKISLKGSVTRCFSLLEAARLSQLASVESLETMRGNAIWLSKYGLISFFWMSSWGQLNTGIGWKERGCAISIPGGFKIHLYKSPEQPGLIMLGRFCHCDSEMFLCCGPVYHLGPQFGDCCALKAIVHRTVIRFFFFSAIFLSIVKYIFKINIIFLKRSEC